MLGGKIDSEFEKKASECVLVVEVSGGKKKVIGYYPTRSKNAALFPVKGAQGFLESFMDDFFRTRKNNVMLNFLGRHRSLANIWKIFFLDNPKVTMMEKKEADRQDSTDKEFQNGPNNAILKEIYELIEKENYLYLHPANEEGTLYDILLLKDREKNTFNFVGTSGHKDLTMFLVNALDMSEDAKLKEWFAKITEIGRGAFKSKKHVMEVLLGILSPLEQYRIKEVVAISNNKDKPSYNYLDLEQYEKLPRDVPTPSWDAFCDLFNSEAKSELFKAWVYSIFFAANTGRQWMWIQGSGSDGKSSVVNAIQKYMDQYFGKGKSYHTAMADSYKSHFFGSSLYNKRLLVFGDNRYRRLFNIGTYLGISGGDHMHIEFKFAHPFSAKVYAKILVISNFDPFINFSLAAETSRAIVLKLDPNKCAQAKLTRKEESTYEERLVGEFPYFMRTCREAYFKCIKPGSHSFIVPDEILNEMKATCAMEDYNLVQYFLHCCLEYGPHKRVRETSLITQFKIFCDESLKGIDFDFLSGVLRNELTHTKACRYLQQPSPSGIHTNYVIGCKLKDVQPKSYAAVLREEDAMDRVRERQEVMMIPTDDFEGLGAFND